MLGLKVNYTTKQALLALNGHFPEKLKTPKPLDCFCAFALWNTEEKTLWTREPQFITLAMRFLYASAFYCA